jgi:hypothetical protein
MTRYRQLGFMAVTAAWICGIVPAHAYRPFDGTDAAVADHGQLEIELGPAEYRRADAERTLFAPDTRFNYGFAPGWEAVLEGMLAHSLGGRASGTSLVENGAFLKGVLREGGLQEKTGPSIATEFGVLLPEIHGQHGAGASLAGIVSQRWDEATVHLNVAVALTREQHADLFGSVIIEGPHDWPVRPVAEVVYDRAFGEIETKSALVGAIWQVHDNLALDLGLRGGWANDHPLGEIRGGLTFSFAVGAERAGDRQ